MGDDVAAGEVLLHAVQQVALRLDSTTGKGNILRLGVDQFGEEMLRFIPWCRPGGPPRLTDLVRNPVDITMQGCGGVNTERV